MAVNRIPISMISATALSDHVAANMGLDVRANMGIPAILAKMTQAGYQTEYIEIDDGIAEPVIRRVEPKRERHTPHKRMVQLRIEPQEKPGGSEPVFCSVNGSAILIPRGSTEWVDFKYYHCLKNAVAYVPIQDEEMTIIGWRKVPDTPVSVFHIEPKLTKAEKEAAAIYEAEQLALQAEARDDDEDEDRDDRDIAA